MYILPKRPLKKNEKISIIHLPIIEKVKDLILEVVSNAPVTS